MDNTANGTAASSGAQAPAEAPTREASNFWALTLGSVGVVYGDIGTSPLYAFREAVRLRRRRSGPVTREIVLGVLSLIVWSLIVVVTLKYIVLLLRDGQQRRGRHALAHGAGVPRGRAAARRSC